MKLKLVEKKDEAKGIKSFFFEPETAVNYAPGQFFYITLPKLNYEDSRGDTRHFTISSSPTEGKRIRFTSRLNHLSGYKRTLDELPIGSLVEGEGPEGIYDWDENVSGSHVFIAGGIGITPFRSRIKFSRDKNLDIEMKLIYGASRKDDFVFLDELRKWKGRNFNFITSVGRIDEILIRKKVPELTTSTFWVCGPPGMVDQMEKILRKLKIPEEKILTEKFTGYQEMI